MKSSAEVNQGKVWRVAQMLLANAIRTNRSATKVDALGLDKAFYCNVLYLKGNAREHNLGK